MDILFLQSVLHTVRSRSAEVYEDVKHLLTKVNEDKRCAIFSNDNHRQTYVHRAQTGVTDDDYNINVIQVAVNWLNNHWEKESGNDLNLHPVILTDSSKSEHYSDLGCPVMTVKQLVEEYPDDLLESYAQFEDDNEQEKDNYKNVSDPMTITTDGDKDESIKNGTEITEGPSSKRRRILYPNYLPERKAKIGIKNGRFFQGTYHPGTYNVTEATVTTALDVKNPTKRTQVLIVGRENQNRAIDGDVVVIEVLPKEEWKLPSNLVIEEEDADVDSDAEDNGNNDKKKEMKLKNKGDLSSKRKSAVKSAVPTGKVVAIAQRNWRPYCGTVSERSYKGGENALFVPMDRNVPKIRIRSRRISQLLNKRVLVIVDQWDRSSVHPSGHVIREIGSSEDKETETEVILIENGITTRKFSDDAMACLPDGSWKVSEEHCKSRWDLREFTVCSVDPPGCTDIDDALHFRRINEKEVEIGVHIADVTAFVAHDSALDKEAAERGCTVYLVDRRIEMLPSLLSGNLCSLRGGEERLAFSTLIRLNSTSGNVTNVEFGRSVIKSSAALTYEQAQNRIDSGRKLMQKGKEVEDKVTEGLMGLAEIAKTLRAKRMAAGALVLASPEVKFKISEARDEITDVSMYEIRETNKMVEEFMLLANVVVGEKMLKQFPHCSMLRRHPKPSNEMFESLIKAAKFAGYDNLDVSDSKKLNESLTKINEEAKAKGDEYLGTLLRIIATRCMTQAVYFSSGEVSNPEYLHYGLAAPVYTHFTSPIRRYADVLVHRLLSACLGFNSLPVRLQDSKHMNRYAEAINQRHRCAQFAARASTLLHTVLLFRKQGETLEEDARIIRIMGNGFVVLVPRYGVEGVVYVKDDGEGEGEDSEGGVEVDEQGGWMKVKKNGKMYHVLGAVRVRIRIDSAPERMDKVIYELID